MLKQTTTSKTTEPGYTSRSTPNSPRPRAKPWQVFGDTDETGVTKAEKKDFGRGGLYQHITRWFNLTRLNNLQQSLALTIKVWACGKEQPVERQQCTNKSFTDAAKQIYLTM